MTQYKVARFQIAFNVPDQDSLSHKSYIRDNEYYRDYVSLGDNLSWEEAKNINRENKGSWIVKE